MTLEFIQRCAGCVVRGARASMTCAKISPRHLLTATHEVDAGAYFRNGNPKRGFYSLEGAEILSITPFSADVSIITTLAEMPPPYALLPSWRMVFHGQAVFFNQRAYARTIEFEYLLGNYFDLVYAPDLRAIPGDSGGPTFVPDEDGQPVIIGVQRTSNIATGLCLMAPELSRVTGASMSGVYSPLTNDINFLLDLARGPSWRRS